MISLLTEKEVAAVLRCKLSQIQRLRRTGQLAFLPWRPVLIRMEDLIAFIDGSKLPPASSQPQTRPSEEELSFMTIAETAKMLELTESQLEHRIYRGVIRYLPLKPKVFERHDVVALKGSPDLGRVLGPAMAPDKWARIKVLLRRQTRT